MSAYITNKLLSFGIVLACILGTFLLFGYGELQWQLILLGIVIFGYAHFLVGFYYQLRGFARASNAWQRYVAFAVLSLGSLVFTYLILQVFGFTAALFFGFLYFLLHGLLNEQTLIERQTALRVPLLHLGSLAVFVIALLTYSVPDQTFFFNYQLQFIPLNEFLVTQLFENYYLSLHYFPVLFWIGVGSSLAVLAYSWRRFGHAKLASVLALLIIGSTALVWYYGAPAYIYMYLLVVGYHFITWLLFYLVEFKRRGTTASQNFILINVGVFSVLTILAFMQFAGETTRLGTIIFDYRVFVAMTYVHISTSFMNDLWCKQLEVRVFGYFLQR